MLVAIMDLGTCLSTSWAGCALFPGFHMYLDAFICSHALIENREFGQIQRHDDLLIWLALSCSLPIYAMLVWHCLSLVRLGCLFLLHQTKDRPIVSFLCLFAYPLSAFTLIQREPNKSTRQPNLEKMEPKLLYTLKIVRQKWTKTMLSLLNSLANPATSRDKKAPLEAQVL